MADEKLNVSPEENPQPSLFDAGPEGAPAQDAPAPEPPAPENAPEQTGGEPPAQDAPAGAPGAVNVSADQIENNELTYSDVRPTINRIRAFLPAAAESAATGNTAPKSSKPKISFAWGTMTHTGTLESFQATYQMFAFDGTPVQAEVSITIRGEDPDVSASINNQALGDISGTDFLQQDDALYLSGLSWLFQ